MAFQTTTTLKGAKKTYAVAPTIKRYTLRDNGFEETKAGNFQLIRGLDTNIDIQRGYKLKITVDKTMKLLKMSTVTKNELQAVQLYGKDQLRATVEKLDFILDGLVERGVLMEVE